MTTQINITDLKLIIADKELLLQQFRMQIQELVQANAQLAARIEELDPKTTKEPEPAKTDKGKEKAN